MNHLAYGIVRDDEPFRGDLPRGLDAAPLVLVAAEGLAFACSDEPADLEPRVERLLAYARVVEDLHRLGTVLPMRYGSVVSTDGLRAKLRARRAEFHADLQRLDGCEEVTLRFALPDAPAPEPAAAPGSGKAYLLARRQRYAGSDAGQTALEHLARRFQDRFAGLFVALKAEPPGKGAQLALHVLVRRGGGQALADAVDAKPAFFPGEWRISGPWPVYNFLTPAPSALAPTRS